MNEAVLSHIVYTTEARGLSPRQTLFDRRGFSHERFDEVSRKGEADLAEEAATKATVLAQPHRLGSDDKRMGTALGRFCAGHKPYALGEHLFASAERYGDIIREYKNAMGFSVPGWAPSDNGYRDLTEAQIQARKELAVQRKGQADAILICVHRRGPRVLEWLTFDDRDPVPHDESLLVNCLLALADEWRLGPHSIRDDD